MVMEKPNKGDIKRDNPISLALSQLTASPTDSGSREYANPTPNMEPIRVCELEQGMPRYQVNKFQKIAVRSNARTIARL